MGRLRNNIIRSSLAVLCSVLSFAIAYGATGNGRGGKCEASFTLASESHPSNTPSSLDSPSASTSQTESAQARVSPSVAAQERPSEVTWLYEPRYERSRQSGIRKAGIYKALSGPAAGLQVYFEVTVPKDRLDGDGKPIYFNGSKKRPTIFFDHGIAENMMDLEELRVRYERNGWGVVSVDVLAHGQSATLNPNLDKARITPDVQIALTTGLAQHLGLKRNVLRLGHSMGGGLAKKGATNWKEVGIKPMAVVSAAGFVGDIEKWLLDNMMRPGFLQNVLKLHVDQAGMSSMLTLQPHAKAFGLDPHEMENAITSVHEMWDRAFEILTSQQTRIYQTLVSHPMHTAFRLFPRTREAQLREMWSIYLTVKNQSLPEEYRDTPQQIEARAYGAALATMGMPDLNYLHPDLAPELDPSIPILYLSGKQDPIVQDPHVNDFKVAATRFGYNVQFRKLNGNHQFPQMLPDQTLEYIRQFLLDGGLIHPSDLPAAQP